MRKLACIFGIALLTAGCTETTQPDPGKDIVLTAASPTSLSIVAGSYAADLPTVIAQDANGTPRGGVVIYFAVEAGYGQITVSADTTNSSGIAGLRYWRAGTKAGQTTTVTATAPNGSQVVFVGTVIAGPPSHMTKIAGDNQIGPPASLVPIKLQARLTDLYDNPLPNVQVSLSVTEGGGTVSPTSVATDSLGLFSVDTWVLGDLGEQMLVAQAGSAVQGFRATAVTLPTACLQPTALLPSPQVAGLLATESCNTNGKYFTSYLINIPSSSLWAFEMHSNAFDPYIELVDSNSRLVARNDDADGSKNSRFHVMLLPGTYLLSAYSNSIGVGGAFSLSFTSSAAGAAACDGLFVIKGDSLSGSLHPLTCNEKPLGNTDLYRIHVAAGDSLVVHLRDMSYSSDTLEILDERGRLLTSGNLAESYLDYVARYSADTDIDLVIKVSSEESGAAYSISFR